MAFGNIPDDINIELLLSYFPEGSLKVAMRGLHKRNAYNDIVDTEEKKDGTVVVGVGRNSLYNALPEYMFHPIDRFDTIPKVEEKERFTEEYEKQEREKEQAFSFFLPVDLSLLKLKVKIRECLNAFAESNKVLNDILGDRLTKEQQKNRFIRQLIPFLPSCKDIRGNKTLLTFLLRKVFMTEGLRIDPHKEESDLSDSMPRYVDYVGGILEESYVNSSYTEDVLVYDVSYWSDEECNDQFLKFIDDLELFRGFVEDYFLAIGVTLRFNVSEAEAPLRLSDEIVFNYLNYNTNI